VVVRRILLPLLRLLVAAVIVAVAVKTGPVYWHKWFPQEKKVVFVPTSTVKKGDLTLSVRELGNIDAAKSESVSAETEGKVIFLVAEGKPVVKGEVLVRLDDMPLKDNLRTVTLEYSNSQANIEKAKLDMDILRESNATELKQQEADLEFNKSELDRAKTQRDKKKRLAADKLIPLTEVELADIEVKSKELAVSKGDLSLILKKKEIQSKESQKEADVKNVEFASYITKSRLDEAKRRLGQSTVISPGSGLAVLQKRWIGDGLRKLKEGDNVHQGMQILQIPDLASMTVKVNVDEADIARVRVGQKTRMTVDALPGMKFTGSVVEISNLATETNPWESSGGTPGRKNFEVKIKVDQLGATKLRPGMTSNTEIISDIVPKCIFVPIESVYEKNGKWLAYVKDKNGSYKARSVKVGKRNDSYVAVLGGLTPGEIVALRDPTKGGEVEENKSQAKKPVAAPVPTAKKKS